MNEENMEKAGKANKEGVITIKKDALWKYSTFALIVPSCICTRIASPVWRSFDVTIAELEFSRKRMEYPFLSKFLGSIDLICAVSCLSLSLRCVMRTMGLSAVSCCGRCGSWRRCV